MTFQQGALFRIVLFVLAISIPVLAEAADGKSDCFGFNALDDDPLSAQLYEVQPGDKVEFQCPERSLFCSKGAFVLPGDQVVVTRIDGNRGCAEYLNAAKPHDTDTTAGWLPLERLSKQSPRADWVGIWGDDETKIIAKQQGDKVRVDATTTLQLGSGDEGGQFAAVIDSTKPLAKFGFEWDFKGNMGKLLAYQEKVGPGICQVKMNQLGRYLVVGDNHMCGGINVSFSRVYRRAYEKVTATQAQAAENSPEVSNKADGIRPSYGSCLESSEGVTLDMRNCASAEYKYQDDRLNTAYRRLRTKLEKNAAARLRDEQRGWIAQRDKQCEADKTSGTSALIVSDDCSVTATARRAAELESKLFQ
ncbi:MULTISPECIES: lysozyme inhibitor LprI family protein [Rhizobium]|uniref:Lysozyme inhibitor LprI family protein n=1 Tax=Rhizobium rhododendri TaxID=2506430 RepID=A0ABY8ISS1_9HYPH|nr:MULTISPECIES: lysozyme inhibitor LprI family protein [Rhizobium]WFS25954.1 lysozyme inhibitor LprI family protein [Rhizobium rhododendri]